MLRLLCLLAAVYVLLLVGCALLQRKLIYLPFRRSEATMLGYAAELRMEPWRDRNGSIIGWKRAAQTATRPTNRLVVFHGNAGFALMRIHYVEAFSPLGRGELWDVYLFEYPGYGSRSGKISELSFLNAGRDAIAELRVGDSQPVFLLGESIGSGPACALAAQDPNGIAGVFLVTPFSRLADVARHHYGWLPVNLMLRDRWDNLAALDRYAGPLAMLLAGEDEVIPTGLGRKLFDQAREPKRLWIQAGAGHNSLSLEPNARWWPEVSEFLIGASTHR